MRAGPRRSGPLLGGFVVLVSLVAAVGLAPGERLPGRDAANDPAVAPLEALPPDLLEVEDPAAGMESFMRRRTGAGPGGAGLAYLRAARRSAAVLAQVAPGAHERRWTPLGPANLGGRIRALVVDPRDPDVLYTGGTTGGVWKSTDAAATWQPLTETFANVGVSAIAIDPADSRVVYVGTGEHFANLKNFKPFTGVGIMKTTDAGATWRLLPGTLGNPAFNVVHDIVISSGDPRILYAGISGGVARSTDAGETWEIVRQGVTESGCSDLAIRTDRTPDVVLANCSDKTSDGVYRTEDGGTTWVPVIGQVNGEGSGNAALAIAPSNQDVVYASVARVSGSPGGSTGSLALLRSNDGGVTWASQNDGGYASAGSPSWLSSCPSRDGQGSYGNAIAVDPTNPDRIWVGGVDLYRSDDGGRTLTIAGYWWVDQIYRDQNGVQFGDGTSMIHADFHAITFPPNYDGQANQTVYFGNDGGVFRTQNANVALTNTECDPDKLIPQGYEALNDVLYESMNEGLSIFQFWGGGVSNDGTILMGGAQDNGVWVRPAGADAGGWTYAMGGDGFDVAIHPSNTPYYGTNQFLQISRSSTGGVLSFGKINTGLQDTYTPFNTMLAMDPRDPSVLWTAGARMWRTRNGGDLWVAASGDLGAISAIAIAPSDSAVVYAGDDFGASVHVSTNATSDMPTWTTTNLPAPGGLISSIGVHPADPRTAYATVGDFGGARVWKTTDAGATWQDVSGDLPAVPAQSVAVNPMNPEMVFVGTDAGLFESPNGGLTWLPANGDFTSTIVQELVFRPGTSELYMFTYGRGAFRSDVGTGG